MTKYKKLKENPKNGSVLPKGKMKECEDKEIQELTSKYNEVDTSEISSFEDMPLSSKTLKGLSINNYTTPTEIQRESIILALRGRDILGAAKTGSGKTLAFLIPVMEILYCRKWTNFDGVGAIIITPTRELALQIYETLVKVGKFHEFSAGLIIGGKDLHFEKNRLHNVNILICTPGRLLQHMDENPLFTCLNMQILVLDEADRCLDMGFKGEMNSIIENLPATRQTLLFSATQTKNVKDLARLSLVDPEYVSVHEHEKFKTPDSLTQSYIVCEYHDKMTLLWSFIKTHSRQKIMIFLSTCNQVRYVTEIFRKLRPRNPLFALQGKLHQMKRMEIYHSFCRKEYAVLFSTDIASRGLDFPNVDWVVQCDCPEDVDAYVHRVGRTARNTRPGESLLIISKSELGIIEKLTNSRIPISEIKVNQAQLISPQAKLELFVAKNSEMKECAQRAFVSYFKSVFLMKDKSIFDVKSIDAYKYARSLGLIAAPRVRFIQRSEKKLADSKINIDSESKGSKQNKTKNENQSSSKKTEKDFNFLEDNSSDSETEGFSIKQKAHDLVKSSVSTTNKPKPVITRAKLAKKILKSNKAPNKKIIFDQDKEDEIADRRTNEGNTSVAAGCGGINIDEIRKRLQEEDSEDRKLYAEVSKNRKMERKRKEKGKKEEEKMFEEDDDDDGSSSEPDLSWLPDPDRVYNKNKKEEYSESENLNGKRKLPLYFDEDEDSSDDDSPLPLEDKEKLALKLMGLDN